VDAGGFGGALRGFVVLSEAEECQAEHSLSRASSYRSLHSSRDTLASTSFSSAMERLRKASDKSPPASTTSRAPSD
jgi:hypothetical protein